MFIVIALLFFAFCVVVVWAALSFHNVLQKQRYLNIVWTQIEELLQMRNEMLAHFQDLWVRVMAQPEQLTALQKSLTADAAHPWEDVKGRAALRNQIEDAAHALLREIISHPEATRDEALKELLTLLAGNTRVLQQEVRQFNKAVDLYNAQLQKTPNSFTAQHFGAVAIPRFTAEFRSL